MHTPQWPRNAGDSPDEGGPDGHARRNVATAEPSCRAEQPQLFASHVTACFPGPHAITLRKLKQLCTFSFAATTKEIWEGTRRVGPGGEPHGEHRTAPAAPTALSNGRRRPPDRAEISPPAPPQPSLTTLPMGTALRNSLQWFGFFLGERIDGFCKVGYAFHYKKKSVIKTQAEESLLGKIRGRGRRRSAAEAGGSGWVELLLRSKFFGVCEEHKETRKSEENIYCVDCGRRMCPHCVAGPACPHRGHRLLQIRRYVYQDVVRVHDMQKLLDCSRVQPYTVNGAKVVLLNPRTQSKPSKSNAGGSACEICRRSISEPNRCCSIACMVDVEGVAARGPVGCNPSEPYLPTLTAGLEGSESPSCSVSPQPSDAGPDDFHPWITEAPCRKVHRRKGCPRRAPLL
ncbi:zinc-binding protein [Musa troglodytarum]|uniref:Zinc-binding protein n=1 Tax=Musa troglodytarum TaxID=320322 RepID=A0A9E7GKH3_9LILI|nr:zinc-binding protein [Musa troglodytarum]